MNDLTTREPANDPQDLERLLVARENAGDVTGMTALFEPDAVVDIGGGTFLRGKEAIHEFFTKLQVTGFGPEKRKFEFGEQRPALICGDLALTSTRSRNGTVTSEVARRQKDGTWLTGIPSLGDWQVCRHLSALLRGRLQLSLRRRLIETRRLKENRYGQTP
jgi:hypothetical protein